MGILTLRILHLVDRLTDRGGAYRHLLGVIEALATAGHEQVLAFGEADPTVVAPCPTRRVAGLASRTAEPVPLEPLEQELRPDVVHLHTIVNPAVIEWAAGTGVGVMTLQDHRLFCPGRGKWTRAGGVCRAALSRDLCRACFADDAEAYCDEILALTRARLAALTRLRRVVVLSRYMRDELQAVGVAGESIEVVPPFVHGLDLRARADGPPCVLFVGRLVESKGVADALAAWRASQVGLPLVFAGTGPLRTAVERAGHEVLGWLERGPLARAYRRAAVVLLPSLWQEPFGIVGLEALTLGVPVAAYDSGGVSEWHPGVAAGLVPWGEREALGSAIARLRGQAATPPRGFERDAVMSRLLDVYVRVAAARGTPRDELPAGEILRHSRLP